MEDYEKFRTDPIRFAMLEKIIKAYDNAVICHQLDENQNIIAVYDKYSNIQINKLIRELRQYENHEYNVKEGVFPFPCVINGKLYEPVVKVEKTFDVDTNNIEYLEKQLKTALEKEDYHACERIKNKISKLKNQ